MNVFKLKFDHLRDSIIFEFVYEMDTNIEGVGGGKRGGCFRIEHWGWYQLSPRISRHTSRRAYNEIKNKMGIKFGDVA